MEVMAQTIYNLTQILMKADETSEMDFERNCFEFGKSLEMIFEALQESSFIH